MNINNLVKAAQKPVLYTPGTTQMWTDPHISTQLLDVHLSQHTNLASRKKTTIESTIHWITSQVSGKNLNILDLGCGPGLYAEKLFQMGHQVTGMDISSHSINYAKKQANIKGLDISYINANYLELSEKDSYDLIMIIFTDFGVLTPDQQKTLLKAVYRALKPGGTFIFDVLNHNALPTDQEKNWEVSESGLWKNEPYITLSETFFYESEKVQLSQHVVMDEAEEIAIYRFWTRFFKDEDLNTLCSWAGFKNSSCHENILPDSELYSANAVTFCRAVK